jgi:ABC-type siderophore export system fused ATPase/permease subunit
MKKDTNKILNQKKEMWIPSTRRRKEHNKEMWIPSTRRRKEHNILEDSVFEIMVMVMV